MFPIGANLTQGNLVLFRNAELEIQVIGHMQTGSVEIWDKEKPLRELALTSTANFKILRPTINMQTTHL